MFSADFEPRPARLAALFAGNAPPPAPVPTPAQADPAPDLDAIRDAAFACGVVDGEAAAAQKLAPLRQALAASAAAFDAACQIDVAALREPFTALLTRLSQAVIAAELHLAPELVVALVEGALGAVSVATDARLHLNPADAVMMADESLPIPIVADPEIDRGAAMVVAPRFVVADSFETRLAQLLAQA
jgi:flagellar biosynthesis/type III secretory pathway protein FliH